MLFIVVWLHRRYACDATARADAGTVERRAGCVTPVMGF